MTTKEIMKMICDHIYFRVLMKAFTKSDFSELKTTMDKWLKIGLGGKCRSCGGQTTWFSNRCFRCGMKAAGTFPNSQEQELQKVLDQLFPGEYEYIGDMSVCIAGKYPDFICKARKKLIEFNGEYWHQDLDKEQKRTELFAQHGYQTLLVWGRELTNLETLKQKILHFHAYEEHK